MKSTLLALSLAALFAVPAGLAATPDLTLDTLRCEYLQNPIGLGETLPRLSWVARSAARGEKQTAYQILVASSPALLAEDKGDLWDSGKVASAENAQIAYAGKPLVSRQAAWWKVRAWNAAGEPSAWSEPATWEIGFLSPDDWKAQWIEAPGAVTGGQSRGLDGAKWIWGSKTAEVGDFERSFSLPGDRPEAATLTIAADDAFEVSVNGKSVGAFDRADGWRTPQVYDLLPLLKTGGNVLSVKATNKGDAAGLCARVVVQYAGRAPVEVVTDHDWTVATQTAGPASPATEVARFGEGPWGKVLVPGSRPVPILRRTFDVADKPIARARLYATALGLYEFHLNGQRVGDRQFAPEWTDYNRRVMYQAYDVTKFLAGGKNALAALLGDGWYCGRVAWNKNIYGTQAALKAKLEITYQDGTSQVIATDDSWKAHRSPILSSDMLDGEAYDARLELPGWADAKLDDSGWPAATARNERAREIVWQPSEPVRVLKELPVRTVTKAKNGTRIFDLGQNMVGFIRLAVNAPAGTKITIRHAEMLNPDGSFYTANYRGAPCVDTYVCRGGGREVWQPLFTFRGFRYVELSGLPGEPAKDAVTGVVVGSDTPSTGRFASSDPLVNQLYSNIVWGQRGNYLSVPTDCPQRDERLGWMGDAEVFIRTATENANVAAFFTKWLVDVGDAQHDDGRFSDISPRIPHLSNFAGTPAWGDAGVICPWTIYQVYGDTRILERHYDQMRRWVEWCKANSTDFIRDHNRGPDFGDWLSINADTPKELLATAYFAHSTDLLARSAEVLGKADDARKYRQMFEDIKKAFIAKYVAPDGLVQGGTQTDYLLALRFDLLPDALRAAAAQHLVDDIKAKSDHLSTGFIGVSFLLPTLTDAGYSDVAFRLLTQKTFPSWLFSVVHGATTIWERWDGWTPEHGFQNVGMNSFNHYSLGSCGQWMFDSLAGVGMDPSAPAYRKLWIAPQVGGDFTEAQAQVETLRGTVGSAWKKTGNRFTLDCVVPVGSTATVVLPTSRATSIREGGKPLTDAAGVKPLRTEKGKAYLEVGSGAYRFTCEI